MTASRLVCLVSGGMDSLVSMASQIQDPQNTFMLHGSYGQKTHQKEQASFMSIGDHYKIPKKNRRIIDFAFLKEIGGSSLTDDSIRVKTNQMSHDTNNHDSVVPDSYVPFRNSILLSFAVSWAEVLGAKKITIGAVFEDSSGYPDCRPNYFKAFNELIKLGTVKGDIEIVTPVINYSKADIVKYAEQLQAPLELTWSCYARMDLSCGECDSCILRLRGFERAGIIDPLPYVKRPKNLL
jgi:7-cyano-7-deazaguanine synthase